MHKTRSFRLCLVLILCVGTVACGAALFRNYGRITPSPEVTRAFEGYQVNPQFRYYVTGQDLNPNAILGLDRSYTLDPRTTWREVEMTSAKLKEFVQGMKAKVFATQTSLYGYEVTDDHGKPIGVWYSLLSARTFVHMNEDGTVRIDTPPLRSYHEDEDPPDRPELGHGPDMNY